MTTPRKPRRRRLFSLTRRRLITGGGLAGAALVVGYAVGPNRIGAMILSAGAKEIEPSAFGPFIKIDARGQVTLVSKHQEMGQGTHAGLAAMVAEELDADWNTVRIEDAPANISIYRGPMGAQGTVGSSAIRGSWNQLRQAGAAARAMFVQAAAARWSVSADSIQVEHGVVMHRASDRRASFGELLAEAARITPPSDPVLKDPKNYTLIGTDRVRRKDSLAKSTGATRYTIDQQLPRMLTAVVAHPQRFGATVASFDAAAARQIRGIVDVFAIPSGVAVVANDTYTALRGRQALKIIWNDEKAEKRSSTDLASYYHRLAEGKGDVSPSAFKTAGDASTAFGGELFDASYDFPYLAHAAMEPMNCVAQIDGWRVKLISGSQMQTLDQMNTARTLWTLPGLVEIETLPSGGSFGRRGIMASDYVVECLHIARRAGDGVPVKLVWTREDDMTAGFYRPMAHHRVWIACGADGFPTAWRHHTVAQTLLPFGANETAVDGIKDSPYLSVTPVVDGQVFTPSIGIPVGFWRSVGHSHTAMVMEHTIDRLARRANVDPAEYRRAIYKKAGRTKWLGVLDLVCERSGWGAPLDEGWARGIAVHESYGTAVAQVAEVQIVNGMPRVRRVVCAVDCGIAVSPNQIAAQMEGSVGFGLGAALYGQVTLVDGVVQQTNFDTYRVLRMHEMPAVETHIVPSTANPTGMGEPGTPPIAPAVANAILALTGKATTRLPFDVT